MEVKPGYKKTEVGVIPDEWEVRSIGQVFRLINGCAFKPEDWKESGTPIIRIQNLNDPSASFNYSRVSVAERNRVEPGDLLFAWSGTTGTSFGARVWTGPSGALNQHIFKVLMDQRQLTLPFSLLVLQRVQVDIEKKAHGFKASFVHVKKADLVQVSLPIPPLPEQRAIAEVLGDVDALLGSLEKLIAKKRDLKQAAMQQLLTGKKRLPGFSGEWEVKTLGQLFAFSGGYSASRDQLSAGGHCYLHYGDIHGATKTFVDVRADYQNIPKLDIPLKRVASKSLLEDGDVVFVDASEDDEGTSRHVVVVNKENIPFISGLHTIVAKSKTNELAHEYRRHCFQTAGIRQQFLFYAVGTKVSGISKSNIPKLKLPVPKVPEQTAIAEVLSDMDAELAALEQRLDKTRELKQGMMQELLTGRTRLV